MFAKNILALLTSIRAREEGRPVGGPPPPVVLPAPVSRAQGQPAMYNRYDQERFIRQKEGECYYSELDPFIRPHKYPILNDSSIDYRHISARRFVHRHTLPTF